jgi:hypothetical protein
MGADSEQQIPKRRTCVHSRRRSMMNFGKSDLDARSTVVVFFAIVSGVATAATAVLPFVL